MAGLARRARPDACGALDPLRRFGAAVAAERFSHVGLLGMGGSSLCPEVLRETFGHVSGAPDLRVLDSTDPSEVRSFEGRIDVGRTLFVVASKSGTTLEPSLFERYFHARVAERVGPDAAGSRFVAITDPGSALDARASASGYRAVFRGEPSIGGRFSALSPFGMVPAAAMGLDPGRLLAAAERMARACSAGVPAARNPGVGLGLLLGAGARQGRDKVTLALSPAIRSLGAVARAVAGRIDGQAGDRHPAHRRGAARARPAPTATTGSSSPCASTATRTPGRMQRSPGSRRAGQPVVRLSLPDRYDIGGEFFRWEIATAVAGAVLGVNPFDQPDVEASKVAARAA